MHIIRSTQRIFYVLPSHFSGGSKHTCIREDITKEDPQVIIKIAICYGGNCWEWSKDTKCISKCATPPMVDELRRKKRKH